MLLSFEIEDVYAVDSGEFVKETIGLNVEY